MILVVDASVAIKWFLHFRPEEEDVPQALEILERLDTGDIEIIQPPHFVAEIGAVLAREKPDEALEDLADLQQLPFRTDAGPAIYATAADLAIRYRHHLFDTLYHAVALHTSDAVLITADQRYYNKIQTENCIQLLADFCF